MRVILFNLYPYRASREQQRRQRIIVELLFGIGLGALLCFAIGAEFSDRTSKKQRFMSNLSVMESVVATQVKEVQAKKDRVVVLERQIGALQAVEKEALLASHWISFLDATVPPTVSITKLSTAKNVMTIQGFTNAVSNLAAWVDQMESGNDLFHSVDLVNVNEPSINNKEVKEGERRHMFEIKVLLREASK